MASRFGSATESEIKQLKTNINAKNTLKANRKAAKQLKDYLTKNHRENDKELTRGFMPEIRDSNLCPVKSFVSYTSKLNPLNDKLWQKPNTRTVFVVKTMFGFATFQSDKEHCRVSCQK